jgi:FtsP/CotA-like multicopper oxidase with cupredoxin domain
MLQVMHIGANVGRITLAARWGPNLGEYMMHCHNNVHEDNDMFRAFMVRFVCCVLHCCLL